ncbi:MAG: flippase [Anaerolineae bacterium]|nr:flippase [Anaerolineae bacterium]
MEQQSRQIFKNTLVLGIADLVTRLGGMVLSFFIGRLLGADGLGVYSTAVAYYALLILAGSMGAENFLIREIARNLTETSRYVVNTSLISVTASVLIALAFFFVLPYLGYSDDLTLGMYLIILATVPGMLSALQNAVFVAHQRVEFVMYTRVVATTITIGLDYYLLKNGYSVANLLAVFVGGEYLTMVFFYAFISRHITRLHWTFDFPFVRQLLSEIKTFAALSLLGGLMARPEIIILSIVQNETETGFYSAAIKLVLFWQFISQIFMTNVYPVLSQAFHVGDRNFQIIQDKAIKYLLALSLPLMAGLIAAAEPLIRLIYGSEFEPAILGLRILAISIPPVFVNAVFWRVLVARDHQNLVFQARVITLFFRFIGGWLLITWGGANGAAAIFVLGSGFDMILFIYYLWREDIRINLVRLSWRFALASLGMGSIAWFLGQYIQVWWIVPVAAVIYTILIVVLKAFSVDDMALFRKVLRPASSGAINEHTS